MTITRLLSIFLLISFAIPAHATVDNFRQAKMLLKRDVYHDQNIEAAGDFYCGCDWQWMGESGGRVDQASCGYVARAQENRAQRIEWEHVVPAWTLGHQRQCWQQGGRSQCAANDPTFRRMEADPHNLVVSVGEVNADRSNYRFGMLPGTELKHGACDVKVEFKQRVVEPRDEVKGRVARIYFYMHDRYNLSMSRQQQQLFLAWDRQYPVTPWEVERDRRIAGLVGHGNPFVSGARKWSLGHKNTGDGLVNVDVAVRGNASDPLPLRAQQGTAIRGNRNSRVYHLPEGCPSYGQVSERNIVTFTSEKKAQNAGYRKAGNCR